ncbi:MAG: TetR/AcrR family transcriptional regulator [Lachnospiraceae bacterium]|nr:TetR/AcrR family transcriptional regulator [Lachnospiraceae bacterium]
MELRETILEGTIRVFNQKGLKFTMDDVAKTLGMSKKTIYTVFDDKESMFYDMVDYMFDRIKESEQSIVADESLSTLEKIRRILGVMPESYRDVDFHQLYQLKEKYPAVYKQVERRLETGWEETIALLEQGMEEGCIRQVHIPIVKMMFEALLEQFFQRDVLVQNKISYLDALNEAVDIIMDGISVYDK